LRHICVTFASHLLSIVTVCTRILSQSMPQNLDTNRRCLHDLINLKLSSPFYS